MSPSHYVSTASVFIVSKLRSLYGNNVNGSPGVRPVINVRADVALTGSGTTSDPFKVVGAS